MTFTLILLFTLLGSVISVSVAAVFLVVPSKIRQGLIPNLVSYAAGTLLGAAFIGLLPKALNYSVEPNRIMISLLVGILLFFILEKFVLLRHCHQSECQVHNAAGPLILLGDALHNLIDGIVIANTFLVSVPAGIVASIAVIAHEVPQEIGDFALLIDYGYNRIKAYTFNLLSNTTALVGAIGGYFALKSLQSVVPYVLTFSAAGFVYIALADILPGLNKKSDVFSSIVQLLLMISGIVTIIFVENMTHL
ncbi:MAG: ZIP family metal transporter [Fibrobacter sp.]|nr:ZIP family metal transporter [Fibrobacter sp.]